MFGTTSWREIDGLMILLKNQGFAERVHLLRRNISNSNTRNQLQQIRTYQNRCFVIGIEHFARSKKYCPKSLNRRFFYRDYWYLIRQHTTLPQSRIYRVTRKRFSDDRRTAENEHKYYGKCLSDGDLVRKTNLIQAISQMCYFLGLVLIWQSSRSK